MNFENISSGWIGHKASSLSDILAHIANVPRAWRTSMGESLGDEEWAGSRSMPAAIALATYGWPEGRAKLSKSMGAAAMFKPSAAVPFQAYDVAGAYPDVGEYCAGNPACMVSQDPEASRTKPIIRFVVSLAASAMTSTDAIINRGAAILSYADKLESDGARVEIVGIMSCVSGTKTYSIGVTLKEADEFLEIDRMAFTMAHPSMLRRVLFGCYERDARLEGDFSGSYGNPSDKVPAEWLGPKSVYFPKIDGSAYRTAELAMGTIGAIVTGGLKTEG